ncbi:MAG: hypothetical protein WAN14_16535 [Candidatus Acidiferrales bacterium]
MFRPFQQLEEKASLENVYDEQSIRALVTEVFNFPRSFEFAPLPEVVAGPLRERIAQAEIRYMTGQSSGVQESDIVVALNTLAARFQTPDYARTSLKQVRVLRMNLLLTTPVFMGKGMMRENAQPGESINSAMSPVQATYLLQSLIEHKIRNPDFQVPPTDWDANYYDDSVSKIQRAQQSQQSGQPLGFSGVVRENPKRTEIDSILSSGISSMTPADVSALLNQTLTTLKIGN